MKTLIYSMLFFTALFIGVQANTFAQTTHYHYHFSYDGSGNRERRIYVGTALKNATLENTLTFDEEEPIVENIGLGQVKIYPNPTKGNLIVEIPEMEIEEIRVLVFSLQGKQLICKNVMPNIRLQLDLSDLPSGIYLMKIISGGESLDWKIIKV